MQAAQHRASAQIRPGSPFAVAEPVHLRALDMAGFFQEAAGAEGGATYAGLIGAGFTSAEIVEHEAAARAIADGRIVRQLTPEGDRVQGVIQKAIASAAHAMPVMAGVDPADGAGDAWGRYCTARAAWKLDPWLMQQERCLTLLAAFLRALPLLPREANRVLYALAAHMKAHRHA